MPVLYHKNHTLYLFERLQDWQKIYSQVSEPALFS